MFTIGWISLENIMLSGTNQAQKGHVQDFLRWNQIYRDRKQNYSEDGGKMGKGQESWKGPMAG